MAGRRVLGSGLVGREEGGWEQDQVAKRRIGGSMKS
jgi:hypothetical protein